MGRTVPRYGWAVDVPLQIDVTPLSAQVAILDATWQDYPQWDDEQVWVAFRAESLVDPDSPPYPGIAVATRGDLGADGPRQVRVEVWFRGTPAGLRCIHETVLSVGLDGVLVGNEQANDMTTLELREGTTRSRSGSMPTPQTSCRESSSCWARR